LAKIDVPHFAGQVGALVAETAEADGVLSFLLVKAL
jgi:hypothetical protein